MIRPDRKERRADSNHPWRARRSLLLLGLAALGLGSLTAPARGEVDPWRPGSNWLYVRAGYAKSAAEGAGDGGGGAGFGFRHMLSSSRVNEWKVFGFRPLPFVHWSLFKGWSFGGFAEFNLLGSYGEAKEIEVPVALDMTRHIMLKGDVKPYVRSVRAVLPHHPGTGDTSARRGERVRVGLDIRSRPPRCSGWTRGSRASTPSKPVNPVFGPGKTEATHWSVKLAYCSPTDHSSAARPVRFVPRSAGGVRREGGRDGRSDPTPGPTERVRLERAARG